MTQQTRESRPGGRSQAAEISSANQISVCSVRLDADTEAYHDAIRARSLKAIGGAHAVLVWTPEGKYTRRQYLSLHAADKAMERAAARGLTVSCVMVDLVPVPALPVIVVGGVAR